MFKIIIRCQILSKRLIRLVYTKSQIKNNNVPITRDKLLAQEWLARSEDDILVDLVNHYLIKQNNIYLKCTYLC